MPNPFDSDPRGPSMLRLFGLGVCFLVIVAIVVAFMIAKYKGELEPQVPVTAEMVDVGDGLPARSDVKFRGVVVGSVSDVIPGYSRRANIVHIDLKPEYASGIPNTVTARVVPANVFAVSSVELVDNGKRSAPLRAGAVISEDKTLPTVLLQTALNKVRAVLAAVARKPNEGIGVLATLAQATRGRGDQIRDAGRDLNDIVAQLNSTMGDDTGPTTLSALIAAADGLRDVAPKLFDALGSAVRPMQTLAEKRIQLTDLLAAGLHTTGTVADAFDHQSDRLINITTQLTPVVGVLADHSNEFHGIATRAQVTNNAMYSAWDPDRNMIVIKIIFSLTPSRTYVRADCPHYGALAGPSCQTAPEVPTAPSLKSALESMGFRLPPGVNENRPNLAPPRDSMRGAGGTPSAPGQDAPPAPPAGPPPAPPPPAESISPSPPAAPGQGQPQSAVIGGNVGPVGSSQERDQLNRIIGGHASAATQLLLGPIARGTTVTLAIGPGGDK